MGDRPDLKVITIHPRQPIAKINTLEKAWALPRTCVGFHPHPTCECGERLEQSTWHTLFPDFRASCDAPDWLTVDEDYFTAYRSPGIALWCAVCGNVYDRGRG